MVELNMVTTRLQAMRQQIIPLMDALLEGAPEEVQERNLRVGELERIADNPRLIVRDIRSEQNHLRAAQRNMGSIPRGSRWSANQSLDQQQRNLQNATGFQILHVPQFALRGGVAPLVRLRL